MSDPYNQTRSAPPQQPSNWNQDPQQQFAQLLQAMFSQKPQQQQPIDYEGLARAAAYDPLHDPNQTYVPGQSGAANPFSNGFFNNQHSWTGQQIDPAAQAATMQQVQGVNQQRQSGLQATPQPMLPFTHAIQQQQQVLPGMNYPMQQRIRMAESNRNRLMSNRSPFSY